MKRFFLQLFQPHVAGRRLLSAVLALYLFCSLLFPSFTILTEADHDCIGHDCPVCLQIQAAIDSINLTGPLPVDDTVGTSGASADYERICAHDYRAPATTLQSLYVRMDE